MKNILIFFLVILTSTVFAQWSTTGVLSTSTLTTGGKVGIGNSSPERTFHVDGGAAGSSMMLGNTTSSNRTSLWLTTDGATGKTSIQSWWSGVNQGILSLNPSGGLVGIGTTTPERSFHVDGGTAGTSMMLGNTTSSNRTSLCGLTQKVTPVRIQFNRGGQE